jgi:hypothetical protein
MTQRKNGDWLLCAPPFMVSVPVTKCAYKSVTGAPSKIPKGIQTELGAIAPFDYGVSENHSKKNIFLCDFQLSPGLNNARRLGSGRSGFYQNKYVKGVGRTLLAANWNDGFDRYHGNGAMAASAGLREYLVTRLLAARKSSHLINPCEDLLLKPLMPQSKNYLRKQLGLNSHEARLLPKIDQRLVCITVKSANFFRYSNFWWWLSGFPQADYNIGQSMVGEFFKFFYAGLTRKPVHSLKNSIGAEEIAAAFAAASSRLIKNILDTWSLGIYWGSFNNNFTMDGRFLDLEVPTVFESPTFGMSFIESVSSNSETVSSSSAGGFIGFEVFRVASQVSLFTRCMKSRFKFLADENLISKKEWQFTKAFFDEHERLTKAFHPLGSEECIIDMVVSRIGNELKLNQKTKSMIQDLAVVACKDLFRGRGTAKKKTYKNLVLKKRADARLSRSEPHRRPMLMVPEFLIDYRVESNRKNLFYNELLNSLDEVTSAQEVASALREVKKI